MSTDEIANGLVDLCRNSKYMEAVNKYYSDGIVSVESSSPPGQPAEMKGIDAIRGKTQWWIDNHQVHHEEVNGPYIDRGGKQFAVEFKMDATQKGSGKRFQMDEMALYTVEGGKIVHEHFFYNAPPM